MAATTAWAARIATMALAMLAASQAGAAVLPPSCAAVTAKTDDVTPIRELHRRAEAPGETDPTAAFSLMCTTLPRVALEYGDPSVELAWWTASMATPLIAYMDKFSEAPPLLEYARPILERHYGKYGAQLGDIHVAYAWTYFRQGRLLDSDQEWGEALKVRERHPGAKKIELQKVLAGLAQVQLAQRRFADAEKTLQRAQVILVENGDTVSDAGAAIENLLINAAFREERFAAARVHAEEQLRIEQRLDHGAQQLVPAYALLGRILERLDEYEQAEQALRHAVELAESDQGPLQRHRFSALYQLAALLNERGHGAEAQAVAGKALAIGEATLGPTAPRLVPVLQVLGDAARRNGELADALHYFERAGAIIATDSKDVEQQSKLDYYRDFGRLQLALGDVVQAESTLATGLGVAADDPTLAVGHALLLLDHARAAAALEASTGREELLQALVLFRSRLPESHPLLLRAINELCASEVRLPAAGTSACVDVRARLEQSADTDPALRAAAFDNLSRLALAQQDSGAAHSLAVRALAAAEATAAPDPLWQAYFQMAQVLHGGDQVALAIFFGKQAIAQIERERDYFTGESRKLDRPFLRDKVGVYRAVADWLLDTGRMDEGLTVLQLMKKEELAAFGVRDAELGGASRGIDLTEDESRLRTRYRDALQADMAHSDELAGLNALAEAGKISTGESRRLQQLLVGSAGVAADRAERIESLLGPGPLGTGRTTRPRTDNAPALTMAARAFGPQTTFAVYLLTDQHLRVLVSAGGKQAEFRTPLDSTQLQRDIGHFLDDIAARRDVTTLSGKLYDQIVRDVDRFAAQQGSKRLSLWLDGVLRYVPVAALHDGQRYLADKYTLQVYAPPATAAVGGKAAGSDALSPPVVRGLGVTQAVGGFTALPAVARELCYVIRGPISGLNPADSDCAGQAAGNGAMRGEGFADSAFTEEKFRQILTGPRDFSVLHIGTHFRLRPGNALRSFLLLGDGSKLTLGAMSSLDFHGIDVVTLSACETGRSGAMTDDGRELEGLSALVQRRGARRVIASLWRVDDASTAQLMRSFYTEFVNTHGDAARGLQEAQRTLRQFGGRGGRSYEHPYYWAGFELSGSGR